MVKGQGRGWHGEKKRHAEVARNAAHRSVRTPTDEEINQIREEPLQPDPFYDYEPDGFERQEDAIEAADEIGRDYVYAYATREGVRYAITDDKYSIPDDGWMVHSNA